MRPEADLPTMPQPTQEDRSRVDLFTPERRCQEAMSRRAGRETQTMSWDPRVNMGWNDNQIRPHLDELIELLRSRGYEVWEYRESEFDKRDATAPFEVEFDYEFGAEDDAADLNELIATWAKKTNLTMDPGVLSSRTTVSKPPSFTSDDASLFLPGEAQRAIANRPSLVPSGC